MMYCATKYGILVVICFSLLGCTRQAALKRTLVNNPELVFDALLENPVRFMEVMKHARAAVKKNAEALTKAKDQKEIDADLKSPKTPLLTAAHVMLGDVKAPILIVNYCDFQFVGCKKVAFLMSQLREKYGDKISYVYKNYPLEEHRYALAAAKRFSALAQQGAAIAYRFHEFLYLNQPKIEKDGEAFLDAAAKIAGGDIEKMKAVMDTEQIHKQIDDDIAEADIFEMNELPALIVAGVRVRGTVSQEVVENIISERLAAMKVSALPPSQKLSE